MDVGGIGGVEVNSQPAGTQLKSQLGGTLGHTERTEGAEAFMWYWCGSIGNGGSV